LIIPVGFGPQLLLRAFLFAIYNYCIIASLWKSGYSNQEKVVASQAAVACNELLICGRAAQ
jgi:hypothetical protein